MFVTRKKIATLGLGNAAALSLCLIVLSACSRYVDVTMTEDESAMMDSVLTFLETVDESELAGAFISHISYQLPEDRGYNKKRNETKYNYRFLPDSLFSGNRVRVVAIDVRISAASEVPIQNIRFFVDQKSLNMVAMRLHRKSESLLYREESRVYLEGRKDDAGSIIPVRYNVETTVKAFFSDSVHVSTYSDFDASGNPI